MCNDNRHSQSEDKLRLIKDSIHSSIDVSKLEFDIMHDRFINRLRYITQLGQVESVYPTATHTRFAHSIGVMHLAGEVFRYSLANATNDDRMSYIQHSREVLNRFLYDVVEKKEQNIMYSREHINIHNTISEINDGLSAAIVDSNHYIANVLGQHFLASKSLKDISNESVYYTLLSLVRLAGLLHDVGHLPLSHLMEKIIYDRVSRHMQVPKELHIHESMKAAIVMKSAEQYLKLKPTIGYYVISLLLLVNKLDHYFPELHNIIDNIVDVDKLDYVNRDGVATGVIDIRHDIERVIKTFVLQECDVPTSDKFKIIPHVKAIRNIENVIKSRATVYNIIVGHHKSRKYESYYRIIMSKVLDILDTQSPTQDNIDKGSLETKQNIIQEDGSKKDNINVTTIDNSMTINDRLIQPLLSLVKFYRKAAEEAIAANKSMSDIIEAQYPVVTNAIYRINDSVFNTWLQATYNAIVADEYKSNESIINVVRLLIEEIVEGKKNYSVLWKDYAELKYIIECMISQDKYGIIDLIKTYSKIIYKDKLEGEYNSLNTKEIISELKIIDKYDKIFSRLQQTGYKRYNSIYSLIRERIRELTKKYNPELLSELKQDYFIIISPNNYGPGGSFDKQYVATRRKECTLIQEVSNIDKVINTELSSIVPIYVYKHNSINRDVAELTIAGLITTMIELSKSNYKVE